MAMVKQKEILLVISPSVSYHSVAERDEIAVILIQIVMVSPGTDLVKNSITNESQFKKSRSPKLKILGPLSNQIVKLETDAKTLYYSLLKLKYGPSIYLKHKKD